MAIRKYIQQDYKSSTGHVYTLLAVTGATIGTGKGLNQINAHAHRFKDHDSVECGASPCHDKVSPFALVKADMLEGLSPLEIMNAITEAVAKKNGLEVVEFEEETNELSLEELVASRKTENNEQLEIQ
jgi:hypothetical protein